MLEVFVGSDGEGFRVFGFRRGSGMVENIGGSILFFYGGYLRVFAGEGGGFCSCDNYWVKERWGNLLSEDFDDILGFLGSFLF